MEVLASQPNSLQTHIIAKSNAMLDLLATIKQRDAIHSRFLQPVTDAKTGDVFGRSVGFGGWTARQYLDKLAAFKNTPEGKASLVDEEKKADEARAKAGAARAAANAKITNISQQKMESSYLYGRRSNVRNKSKGGLVIHTQSRKLRKH